MKIETNVPIPENVGGRVGGRKAKYPFREMLVGQSILIPLGETTVQKLSSRLTHLFNETGMRFTQRTTVEGIRVWRTE